MIEPLVTIAITTKDRPLLAHRAIRSALSQDLTDFEVVVVDDGSDPPFRLDFEDHRVRVIHRDVPGGPCAARNAALHAARGAWIMFLDDDDRLLPDMVSVSLACVRSSSLPAPVAVLTGIQLVDDSDRIVEERMPRTFALGADYFLEEPLEGRSFQTHNTLLVPTTVLVDAGGWDEEMAGTEHDDLFLRLNQMCSIQGLDRVTYLMTAHHGERRSKDVLARARAMERTVGKHAAAFSRHRGRHSRYLTVMGISYLRAGRWLPAVRGTWNGVMVNPFRWRGWVYFAAALAGPRVWSALSRVIGDRWRPPKP